MFNRYVDGLDTWQPTDPNDYREMGQIMAHVGYVRPDWEKQAKRHRFAKLEDGLWLTFNFRKAYPAFAAQWYSAPKLLVVRSGATVDAVVLRRNICGDHFSLCRCQSVRAWHDLIEADLNEAALRAKAG